MAAEIGNKHAVKLTNPELKKQAYDQYCAHIASGQPHKAWCFEHPDITLTARTMEKYMKEEPDVFPPIHKEVAESKSLKYWFNVLADSATGKNRRANTASLQIIMRNKFGWDTAEKAKDDLHTESSLAHAQVLDQLKALQSGPFTHVVIEKADIKS